MNQGLKHVNSKAYISKQYYKRQLDKTDNIFTISEIDPPARLGHKQVLELLEALPDNPTWSQIYKTYKELYLNVKYNDLYIAFPTYVGVRSNYDPKTFIAVIYIMKQMKELKEKYKWGKSHKISFWYIIHRCLQIQGKDNNWVPLKVNKDTLKRYEKQWKDICSHFRLTFLPIKKGRPPIFKFDKEYWIDKYKHLVKSLDDIPEIKSNIEFIPAGLFNFQQWRQLKGIPLGQQTKGAVSIL